MKTYGQCDVCSFRVATRRALVCGIETCFCAICAGDPEEDPVEEQA